MKAFRLIVLGLVGLLSRPGQAQTPGESRVRAVPLAELVGTWVGSPVVANHVQDSIPPWHLILRADSSYIWVSHGNYSGLLREHPEPWLSLRGDTLALDSSRVYTIERKVAPLGRSRPPELWLTEIAAQGEGQVFRFQREWTSTAITGRPLKCKNHRIQTFTCDNVELLSYLPRSAVGESAGYDLWGWHDSTTGREFLIVGGDATAFLEVTDPVRPKYLGVLPPQDSATRRNHEAQSVKVYRHYAFIGYEGNHTHGLQIFDLTQLRDVKQPRTFTETAHYSGIGSTHTLAINPETGFLYANGSNTCGKGVHMVDVRTPTQPTFAGCYTELQASGLAGQGYVHDTQCVVYRGPDQSYRGREICVNAMGGVVVIADVTDKQHPKTISMVTYPNVGFAHQGWFTADQRYVFLDDEFDEALRATAAQVVRDSVRTRTIGLDLTDLDQPVVLTEFYNERSRATDHNLYIRGRYMYQANYGAGLRILDIADPKLPKEVGYLSPMQNDASDQAQKNGEGMWAGPRAWGPYPYFKNGVVAVSLNTGVVLARLLKP